jgi:predicted nucleic acid-binding protein
MRVLLDANCLVAAALPQHEHHRTTVADLTRRDAAGDTFVMAAHALLEAFAVLTRIPPPHRLAPGDAVAILDRNWGQAEAISLAAAESWRVLRQAASAGQAGGRVYDAVIAAAAKKGKADELLTWNVRHFDAQSGVAVVAPTA